MLARELREGYQLLNPDGSVFYVITQVWADHFSENGEPVPATGASVVGASVRYADGGASDRVFQLDAHVPHVAPGVTAWA